MNKIKSFLILTLSLLLINVAVFLGSNVSSASETPSPLCTSTGELFCPKGFKPTCPENHQPSCVFIGTRQLPACLNLMSSPGVFNYYLDKIFCKKSGLLDK